MDTFHTPPKTTAFTAKQKMYNSSHALYLLETAEMTDSEDLKTACNAYITQHLTSASAMKDLLEGRNITLKTKLQMKGQLFRNLVDRVSYCGYCGENDYSQDCKNELIQLSEEFLSLALKEEH